MIVTTSSSCMLLAAYNFSNGIFRLVIPCDHRKGSGIASWIGSITCVQRQVPLAVKQRRLSCGHTGTVAFQICGADSSGQRWGDAEHRWPHRTTLDHSQNNWGRDDLQITGEEHRVHCHASETRGIQWMRYKPKRRIGKFARRTRQGRSVKWSLDMQRKTRCMGAKIAGQTEASRKRQCLTFTKNWWITLPQWFKSSVTRQQRRASIWWTQNARTLSKWNKRPQTRSTRGRVCYYQAPSKVLYVRKPKQPHQGEPRGQEHQTLLWKPELPWRSVHTATTPATPESSRNPSQGHEP